MSTCNVMREAWRVRRVATAPRLRVHAPGLTPHTPCAWAWVRWPVFLLLVGYGLFCHGCHSDEDTELLVNHSVILTKTLSASLSSSSRIISW
jgi:hypothetical protein